jgi:uncharacterized protein
MTDKTAPEQAETDAQEPSMEDILSSIRRILSEEADGAPATLPQDPEDTPQETPDGGAAAADAGADPVGPEPLVQAQPQARPQPQPRQAERPAPLETPGAATEFGEPSAAEPPFEVPALAVVSPRPAGEPEGLIDLTSQMRVDRVVSQPTAGASADVLAQLAKAILDRRDIVVGGRDVTLEGMVREMLRPLLKEWLDRNLPYLIERLVRKEIDSMINRAERLEE